MRLGTLEDLRVALGGKRTDGSFKVGESYACGLKKAAGFGGTRYFDVDAVVKWRRDHPNWKITDVYHQSRSAPRPRYPAAGDSKAIQPTMPTKTLSSPLAPHSDPTLGPESLETGFQGNTPTELSSPSKAPPQVDTLEIHSLEVSDPSKISRKARLNTAKRCLLPQMIRKLRGVLTQEEMAKKCDGLAVRTIAGIEAGMQVKYDTIKKIANACQVSPEEWVNILIGWIESHVGEDFKNLQITNCLTRNTPQPLEPTLVYRFRLFNAEYQREIVEAMFREEFPSMTRLLNSAARKAGAASSTHSRPGPKRIAVVSAVP